MRKAIAAALIALALVVPVKAATDWSSIIAKAEKSIVYISSDGGSCTGFVIDAVRKYVLTAAHCTGEDIWLDLVAGKLVSKDTQKDLAVYMVKDLEDSRPAMVLSVDDPKIGHEVVSLGYGMGLERPFARKAMISDTKVVITGVEGGPFIGLDAAFVGGQSGGPVVNDKGEVVMIVQRASGTVGIGVGASVIRERTGRFWSK